MVLSLSGLMVACSDDDTTVTPRPDFGITTAAVEMGYTCTPYDVALEAAGGTAPYSWSLAAGSELPDGIILTADGHLRGVLEAAGSWNFSVVCVDANDTPRSDEVELTLEFEAPSNPSIAIFYDQGATMCGSETQAFLPLDCYVFIMLEDVQEGCAFGAEFRISLEDMDGNPLTPGTQYTHSYINYADHVSMTMGDPFNGIAISFDRAMWYAYYGDVYVMNFGLLLLEDLDNLVFKVGPTESSQRPRPIIATCDQYHSVMEVTGRNSALNFVMP
jgi:hypothetical protein